MSELMDRGVLAGTGYDRATQYPTINDLSAALLKQAETKRDYIVDTRYMTIASDGERSTLMWDIPEEAREDDGPLVESGQVNPHAHGQIADRLGIPKAYYDRMMRDAPPLLDANVNGWFARKPERRMVRMLEGRVRAFMSDRYRRLDNLDLMTQAVLPVLQDTPGLHFQVADLTPEKLHINALLPDLTAEVRVGDVVQAGVAIRNSEVGAGALHVAPRVWRLSCRNGLLVDALAMRRYHVGRQAEEDAYDLFSDEALAADDAAYFLKVRDMVRACLTEASFQTIVEQMQRAAEQATAIVDLPKATERLAQRFDLTQDESQSVLRHLASGGDLTQWGAINAVTAIAKEAESHDRQRDLEGIGGVMLQMSRADFVAVTA